MDLDSPRLPWEVIERVIDRSSGHPKTLCSLALTCCQLRPRSRRVMFTRVQLESTDHASKFIAFLLANSRLTPLVRTIVFAPAAFGPSLLYILPNLSSIECVYDRPDGEPEDEGEDDEYEHQGEVEVEQMRPPVSVRAQCSLAVHHTTLACFARLGTRIHILRLSSVSFPTSLAFAQTLVAFASITHLVCEQVEVDAAGHDAPLEVVTRRLSNRMQLKELIMDSFSLAHGVDGRGAFPATLLFDPRLAPSTVESLLITVEVARVDFHSHPWQSDWCRLQRLALRFSGEVGIDGVAEFLERFPNAPSLSEVLIELRGWARTRIVEHLSRHVDDPGYEAFKKLERALLRFPHPRVTFLVVGPVDVNAVSFWAREIGKHLPVLLAHGGRAMGKCEDEPVSSASLHHDRVQALVISPDSKWVATASLDSTIIFWDTINGAIVQRWVAHSYKPVKSLAFSPDSQYLVSGGDDRKAAIWDLIRLSQDASKLATLDPEGHAKSISACAWSPDGSTVATGSEDESVRLWDVVCATCTFRQRAHIRLESSGTVVCLVFSPDGLWLACSSRCGKCCIVDVASGALHRTLWNCPSEDDIRPYWRIPQLERETIAASDPAVGSTRLATPPYSSCARMPMKFADGGSGSMPASTHTGGNMGKTMRLNEASFSADGRLVLGVSVTWDSRKTVKVWDVSTGIQLFNFTRHISAVRRARLSPCGWYVASESTQAGDRTVRLWRARTRGHGPYECVATLSEDSEAVENIAFSPDGGTLCYGARDGTVVIRQMGDIIALKEQDGDVRRVDDAHCTSFADPAHHLSLLEDYPEPSSVREFNTEKLCHTQERKLVAGDVADLALSEFISDEFPQLYQERRECGGGYFNGGQ